FQRVGARIGNTLELPLFAQVSGGQFHRRVHYTTTRQMPADDIAVFIGDGDVNMYSVFSQSAGGGNDLERSLVLGRLLFTGQPNAGSGKRSDQTQQTGRIYFFIATPLLDELAHVSAG